MLRLITASLSIITVTPGVATMSYYTAQTSTVNENKLDYQALIEDIKARRIYGGKVQYREYNGQHFYTEQALNEYLLKTKKITPILTSSNPHKIIKNYEHMTLDPNKIYDVDLNNFQQLYRDAFGNIAYSREQALDTYTNAGLVKPQYSYDGFYWFDSPEEAKINEKYNMQINKSLYYIYKNQYYNAFNTKDINCLVSLMDDGYFVNINQSLSKQPLQKPIKHHGDKKIIYDLLKRDLQNDFNHSYYSKISKSETKYKITMSPHSAYRITVHSKNSNGETSQKDYFAGDSIEFEVLANKNQFLQNTFLDWFKDENSWNVKKESGVFWYRFFRTRSFSAIMNNKKVDLRINVTSKAKNSASTVIDSKHFWNHFTVRDMSTGKIKLYADERKQNDQLLGITAEKLGVYNVNNITTEEKKYFYNKWYEKYFNSIITNFGVNNNHQVTYDDIKKEKYLSNVTFNGTYQKGFIYKDKVYDVNYNKGYSQSLIQSYLNWMQIKTRLLKTPIMQNNQQYYQLRPNFLATKTQLDQFLFLEGNFHTKLMYSYSRNPDVSDRDGRMLAATLQEAKEKQLLNDNKTLRKQFVVYDVFGKKEVSTSSAAEAIAQLKNKIALTSKFVHKSEIANWPQNMKRSWDLTISDGRYLAYRIDNPNKVGDYLYYPSQELALNAVKTMAKVSSDVNVLVKSLYLYNYTTTSGKVIPIVFYNNDFKKVIREIKNIKN